MKPDVNADYDWKRDNMGDYVVTIDNLKEIGTIPPVIGRIIRCHVVHRFKKYLWRTTSRWLLLVNNQFYGFHTTLRTCMERFDKDCVPKSKPRDDNDEYYCWHKFAHGPGPYCTGCGGLIKIKV